MNGPGYNEVFRAEGTKRAYDPRRRNRVELLRWNEEPVGLVSIVSAFAGESLPLMVDEIDELIDLLQQAKAALAGLTKDSGAAASSPAAVAPATPQA